LIFKKRLEGWGVVIRNSHPLLGDPTLFAHFAGTPPPVPYKGGMLRGCATFGTGFT